MLTADEDITTELDRVVCKLMKLALRTSRGRQNPPPTRWLQCKLLDLLTLTEKTIDRRKRYFIENYSLKAISYEVQDKTDKKIVLEQIKENDTTNKIVDRYRHLVQPSVLNKEFEDFPRPRYLCSEMELKDDFSVTSSELLKEYEYIDRQSPSLIDPELILNENAYESKLIDQEIQFDRVRNWIEEDNIEVVPYPNHSITFDNSSGDTDHSTGFVARVKYNKTYKRFKSVNTYGDDDSSVRKTCKKKVAYDKRTVKQGERNNTKKMKSNKIKTVKNVSRKKSNCSNIFRNSKHFDQSSKRQRKYNSTLSKPIPESLKELCHPELSGDKHYDKYQTSVVVDSCQNNPNNSEAFNNVSATVESYLINIVMDGKEETIALRRTIATDTDSDPIQLEYETLIQSISHETNDKFFEEHEPSRELVESQTIFLNDINEPSTSKGIRHNVSMDVQCGSDNITQNYSMLSATTSYTKMPKSIETGVKIGDLYNDGKAKNTEFGTCTDNVYIYKAITPNTKSIGIRIRDSDHILLQRIESRIITKEVIDKETISPVLQSLAPDETKLLKAVSSNLKIEDSGSEFCSSNGSLLKNPLYYVDSNDPNEVQLNICLSREVPVSNKLSSTKYVKPMLCCGGVHIHSYKDKMVSEDVVYQGEWQRYRPKSLNRKRSISSVVLKRVMHPVLKKNDVVMKNKKPILVTNNKPINYDIQNHIKSRNNLLYKPRQITKALKNDKIVNINKTPKLGTIINIKKIASKHTIGALTSKSSYAPRKSVVLSSIGVIKDTNKQQKHSLLKKNYIPAYLSKRGLKLPTSITKNLNESLDTAGIRTKVNKNKMPIDVPVLVKSKDKQMKLDLLKFHSETNERVNYLVFRNEIDSKNSASSEESEKAEDKMATKNDAIDRPHSPQSQNSSTCSSPNSIATIRLVSKKPKSVSVRRNTASVQKSNVNISGSETPTPSKLKKFTKRVHSYKTTKKSNMKNFDNKENFSEKCYLISKQCNKKDKNVFNGSQKNVFIAQLNTDNQSLQSTLTSFSKYKPQGSSFKIPSGNNVDVKYKPGSPSVSNKISLKSETILDVDRDENNVLENSSTKQNLSLLTEPQIHIINKKLTLAKNTAEYDFDCSMGTNFNNEAENCNDIRNAMRQLLEDTLNFIVIPCHNVNIETVPNCEDTNPNYNHNSSTPSFRNTLNNNELDSTLDTTENGLNDLFNTSLGDASMLSSIDTNITVTDLDLLSFKSITSETKLSESYFDGCDFNVHTPKSNSVREIFERKDEPFIQITGGTLAIQAFSGFSVNGEPFVGDQPDRINFVDSETGSLAYQIARQVISDEVFVSGRSSDSYESCVIDEDTVVPNWLFHIISQQQSVSNVTDEPDSVNVVVPMPVEGPMPLAEPAFDINGNTVDPGVVSGTGAGDGRGIHSDQSQDSSGRGTSLSSSETSSEQHSDDIIIDAAAFLEQFEPIGERSAFVVPIYPNEATQPPGNVVGVGVSQQVVESIRSSREFDPKLGLLLAASDFDADVSSLNTDATDSSDN